MRPPAPAVSQHSSFLQDPLLERVAWFCDVPPCSVLRALESAAPSRPPLSHLTCATCNGMAPPALPFLLMTRNPLARPFFLLHWGLCGFRRLDPLTLSPLRVSHILTRVRQIRCFFSHNELVAAFSKCHESAPGADCLPSSLFKVSFPWWRHLLLSFINFVLRFAVVPSAWKSSLVVPVIKRGDPTSLDS